MPLIETLVDQFNRTTLGTGYTANGASIIGNALAVNASWNGAQVFSSCRTPASYTLLGSALVVELTQVPARTANAQIWVEVPNTGATTVNRIGFEYVAPATGTIRLDCIGQTANYAPIGTTQQLAYDATAMRWLRLRFATGATPTLYWETSPDGIVWTVRRTLASPPAWVSGTNTLRFGVEAVRNAAGTNDTVRVDNLGAPPSTAIDETSVGSVTWQANYALADAVAAGYANADWNRQDAIGNGAASGLAWPPPLDVAPFGKPGRCLPLRLRDGGRRYEVIPNVANYADGTTVWMGFSFALDADTPLQSTGYQVIWQVRPDDSTGSPPVSLEVDDGGLVITGGYGRPGASPAGAYDYKQFLAPLVARKWYRLVVRVAYSSAANSGRVDLWLDGARLLNNFVPPPGTNYVGTGTGGAVKVGLYHDPVNRGATMFVADHKYGTGYQAVAPPNNAVEFRGLEALLGGA